MKVLLILFILCITIHAVRLVIGTLVILAGEFTLRVKLYTGIWAIGEIVIIAYGLAYIIIHLLT